MSYELEAVVWCPSCKTQKYEIRRVPAQNHNVFVHKTYPEGRNEKYCECGTVLERKA